MNKYPQIINYGKELYIGYFNKPKNIIEKAIVIDGEDGEATIDIREFLEAELLEENAEIAVSGVEYSVRELSKKMMIELDNHKRNLEQAKKVAINRIIVKEARDSRYE